MNIDNILVLNKGAVLEIEKVAEDYEAGDI